MGGVCSGKDPQAGAGAGTPRRRPLPSSSQGMAGPLPPLKASALEVGRLVRMPCRCRRCGLLCLELSRLCLCQCLERGQVWVSLRRAPKLLVQLLELQELLDQHRLVDWSPVRESRHTILLPTHCLLLLLLMLMLLLLLLCTGGGHSHGLLVLGKRAPLPRAGLPLARSLRQHELSDSIHIGLVLMSGAAVPVVLRSLQKPMQQLCLLLLTSHPGRLAWLPLDHSGSCPLPGALLLQDHLLLGLGQLGEVPHERRRGCVLHVLLLPMLLLLLGSQRLLLLLVLALQELKKQPLLLVLLQELILVLRLMLMLLLLKLHCMPLVSRPHLSTGLGAPQLLLQLPPRPGSVDRARGRGALEPQRRLAALLPTHAIPWLHAKAWGQPLLLLLRPRADWWQPDARLGTGIRDRPPHLKIAVAEGSAACRGRAGQLAAGIGSRVQPLVCNGHHLGVLRVA
mmetsp:Transcript_29150/g.82190  ORF Transcript_29150/g.82190 Transcript_29150/m.82190 type:complete len:453 (+) Transcript_29150:1134-2492(+)